MTFCHLNLHFNIFFTLYCNFFYSNLHFYVVSFYIIHFLIKFFWKFDLNVSGLVEYNPVRASSYLWLPKELCAKRECLNILNNDEKCFLGSIFTLLHPVQHRIHLDKVMKYHEYESELNMPEVKYPIDIKTLTNFNIKTTLVLMSMNVKIKKASRYVLLPWAFKTSCEFIIYHCRWNFSLRIAERLEQIDIKAK